ncbi:MAG: hypothetical protein WDN50_15220 [Bradyrhizobium sp.]
MTLITQVEQPTPVALACAAAFGSVKLTRAKQSPDASLGVEWQYTATTRES